MALFIPFIGDMNLFDWDELNFAESAREMIISQDYLTVQIDFEPFWEKPPLFIWFQVLSMKIFGINEFAARLPNAICGIFTMLILYKLGKIIYNGRFGFLWVIAFIGSFLPFFYFKSGIIDPWFNLFIFLGIFFFYKAMHDEKKLINYRILFSGIFIGLSILTKGPAAFLIFMLTAVTFMILKRFKLNISVMNVLLFLFVVLIVGGSWYFLMILKGNLNLIIEFIEYQIRLFLREDAGHGGFPLYHFIILLFGVFPSSIFSLIGLKKSLSDSDKQREFKTWMIILLAVVLILFSIVNTKIVHYSSLAYFPVSFLAAHALDRLLNKELAIKKWHRILFVFVGSVLALIVFLLPVFDLFKHKLIEAEIIKDPMAIGNLQAEPGWSVSDSLIGLILVSGIILFLVCYRKKLMIRCITALYISSVIFIYLTIISVTPKIEMYTQRAVIDFYKQIGEDKDYVYSFYKSYAVLFYAKKTQEQRKESISLFERLAVNQKDCFEGESKKDCNNRKELGGLLIDVDKNIFFTMRIDRKEEILRTFPQLEFIYEKNGYVFCKKR